MFWDLIKLLFYLEISLSKLSVGHTILEWCTLRCVLNTKNLLWIEFVINACVDNKVLVVLLGIHLELFVFQQFVIFENLIGSIMWEPSSLVRDHLVFSSIIYHHWNLLSTQSLQLHCFLDKASFSLAVGHVPQVKAFNVFQISFTSWFSLSSHYYKANVLVSTNFFIFL